MKTQNKVLFGVALVAVLSLTAAFAFNNGKDKATGAKSECCCGDTCKCCDGCKGGECTCGDACKCCGCCSGSGKKAAGSCCSHDTAMIVADSCCSQNAGEKSCCSKECATAKSCCSKDATEQSVAIPSDVTASADVEKSDKACCCGDDCKCCEGCKDGECACGDGCKCCECCKGKK